MRAVLDALVEAVNGGSAESWEAFAQARFTPALLQQQSRDQRAELYRQLADRFGTIAHRKREAPGSRRAAADQRQGLEGLRRHRHGSRSRTAAAIAGLRAEDAVPQQGSAAGGVPAPPINASMTSAEIDTRLDGYFSNLAADDVFSGVALVARNGVPVFFKAYGLADREKKIPNTIRTRFNIGSINKTFTQVAIRQLVAAGKLSLTDTLASSFRTIRRQSAVRPPSSSC